MQALVHPIDVMDGENGCNVFRISTYGVCLCICVMYVCMYACAYVCMYVCIDECSCTSSQGMDKEHACKLLHV